MIDQLSCLGCLLPQLCNQPGFSKACLAENGNQPSSTMLNKLFDGCLEGVKLSLSADERGAQALDAAGKESAGFLPENSICRDRLGFPLELDQSEGLGFEKG